MVRVASTRLSTRSTAHKGRDQSNRSVPRHQTRRPSLPAHSRPCLQYSKIRGSRLVRTQSVFPTARSILLMEVCPCNSHLSVHLIRSSSLPSGTKATRTSRLLRQLHHKRLKTNHHRRRRPRLILSTAALLSIHLSDCHQESPSLSCHQHQLQLNLRCHHSRTQ